MSVASGPDMNEYRINTDIKKTIPKEYMWNPYIPISRLLREYEWDEITMRDTLVGYNGLNTCPSFHSLSPEKKKDVVASIIIDLAETHIPLNILAMRYKASQPTIRSIYRHITYEKLSENVKFISRNPGGSMMYYPEEIDEENEELREAYEDLKERYNVLEKKYNNLLLEVQNLKRTQE